MVQQEKETHKNQQTNTSETKEGFWSKALNMAKQSFSALAGAGIGALAGSVIPVVGTIVGAIIGAVAGRVVFEPTIKAALDGGEKAIEDVKVPTNNNHTTDSTAVMHDALKLQPQQRIEADITSKLAPGALLKKGPSQTDINKAFDQFEETENLTQQKLGASTVPSPFAIPQCKPSGAASAA